MASSLEHGDVGRRPTRNLSVKLREIHSYLGMLIAPLVLFLAFTGLIQIFSLHEAHGGYTPYPWVEKLGKVHKDQSYQIGKHRPPPVPVATAPAALPADGHAVETADRDQDHDQADNPKSMLPVYLLKWYFAFVAVFLFSSTLIGVWIGLRNPLRRKTYVNLFVIGIVVPMALIFATS